MQIEGDIMNIKFVVGYVEKNCSVRCYTMLMRLIERFKIKYVHQIDKILFDEIDKKSSIEFFKFLEILKEIR